MKFPEIPPQLRSTFPEFFWNWWQSFRSFMVGGLETSGDFTAGVAGKGVVLTNAAGTVTKRVRLNDIGDGFIYEDL